MYLVSLLGLVPIAVWLYAQWDAWRKSSRPKLLFANTDFNTAVVSRCPSLQAVYRSCKFLTLGQGHVETILRAKLARSPGVSYKREILLLECGGAVALDWEQGEDGLGGLPHDAPLFLILPGLTSGSTEPYIQQAVAAARRAGMRAVVVNSRGTSDSPVLTPQFYSASYTEDMRQVVSHVVQRYLGCLLFAAGWSLGGNILINYLAEEGEAVPIAAALSLGNPFDLVVSNQHINKGFNRIYNASLTASMRRIVAKHSAVWRNWRGPAGAALPDAIKRVKSIREFDEAITVHSFGWPDVDAYYAGSSSSTRIPGVTIPLLCIQAADDPIAPAAAIPYTALAANPNCVLVVTPTGGHLGWAAAPGAPLRIS
ncbi:hypothetical protein OEZ86_008779 [Tetradesmus obliquus]|nr:hypothetical protein OEZ86_008779 [Tetradesmus obliquus]